MPPQLFDRFIPPRLQTREFGPWNVLNLITAAAIFGVQIWAVTSGRKAIGPEDYTMSALAISIATQAAEPALPREHIGARVLRIVSVLTFLIGLAGAIVVTLRG